MACCFPAAESRIRLLALARSAQELRLASALAGPGDGDRPLLVCLSGVDHLVAAPFIADGRAIAAPGGLRWLADARANGQAAANEA